MIRELEPGQRNARTIVWTGPDTGLAPAATVAGRRARLALLARSGAFRTTFPARSSMARAARGAVTLVLAGGAELRLGERTSLAAQARRGGARPAGAMTAEERGDLGYLDVCGARASRSAVTSLNSQVEGETFSGIPLQIGI